MINAETPAIRHNWSKEEILGLLVKPFNDLMFEAQTVHRQNFKTNKIQLSTLMNIKTGARPEDCAYCPQSAHYDTGVKGEKMTSIADVIDHAKKAKDQGANRFCMGAAWRQPTDKNLKHVIDMIIAVKNLGMETCVTLGMLNQEQSKRLADAGLDYYNHNLDTSPEYYEKIISTRVYEDRLNTLTYVRDAGINVCSGGIIGMGENESDRAGLIQTLANLPIHPESVPINMLVKVEGTPLDQVSDIDSFDFIRIIAASRIVMPKSYIRLSAGRNDMNDEMQALCFMAGANSIFYGEKLLTTSNPQFKKDQSLMQKLGIQFSQHEIA